MFEGKSLLEILNMGGWVLYILAGTSVLSLTLIFYKLIEFWKKAKLKRAIFIPFLFDKIKSGGLDAGLCYCKSLDSPMASVARAGISAFKLDGNFSGCMEREVLTQIVELEKYLTILGTIGNIAVYIGLFGTVLGIISAFHNMSAAGAGGIAVVIGGVSEALIATATGLFVAIPASAAYNFFTKEIDKFAADMEYCASAVKDEFNLNRKSK
ncbi:MAG: MotA/TolQ/ExbB proton channel family protein [Endomicrobium sp.]|jgi:biopolymer transport protein ExbB|nr:MotA/TolQ/ExbB proton channel family protein [Endomicrobium sp.]